jgi:putative transposase
MLASVAREFLLLASTQEAGAGPPMHMSRSTAKKMLRVLQDLDSGFTVRSACQRRHLSPQTFYRWKNRIMGQLANPLGRLHDLEDENRRLKRKIAELSLDYNALRAALITETRREC